MSQTQLASMFLGNPYITDRDDRLRGVSSLLNAQIHITDGQTGEILDYITAKNIIEDSHKKSLEDTLETYDFITFSNKRYSQHLEKRNRIIIPDEDDTLREFVIFEAIEDRIREEKQVFAHANYLELKKASIIYPNEFEGTASQHTGRALNDTGWILGTVESTGTRTLTVENHTNPFEMLKRIAREFDVELRFRVEHDGNKITGRYVDLLERVGEWQGREVEFAKDLGGIRRIEKQDIVTALLGLGPEDEDGNRLEVLVEDEDALQRWGRIDEHGNLHHLIEPYEIQSERTEMTETEARQYTRTALDKRINTQVTYETTIIDLENVPGMENKQIRFGDTIRIKDTHYDPPLYLEARVFEQTRSIKSRAKKEIKLGDFIEYTEDEVHAIWNQLRNDIRKRVSIAQLEEYAEPKKIESDTPPPIKNGENPIWVDTSKTPKIPYVVVSGEWVKMSPTTPQEVDAYTKQQVDTRDNNVLSNAESDATNKANNAQAGAEGYTREYTYNKQSIDSKDQSVYQDGTIYTDQKSRAEAEEKASQALADAKAFSRNASNINQGVIDVGAIPLRTSETGARLEWDGVNGLVQYDSRGNAVSWLDLDANAHFANAFLSGRVEALEGYFGDNLRLVNGKIQITRPDGAISMNDGMMYDSPSISGIHPMFMGSEIQDAGSDSYRGDAFQPVDGYFENNVGFLDGRNTGFRDVRVSDYRSSIRVQRYYFVHSSRYFVLTYRSAVGSSAWHDGNLHEHLALIYGSNDVKYVDHTVPTNTTETIDLVVDLGKPTYTNKWLDFRIGWAKGWGSAMDYIRFRINNVVQTDFL